jgi:hypothetical protein
VLLEQIVKLGSAKTNWGPVMKRVKRTKSPARKNLNGAYLSVKTNWQPVKKLMSGICDIKSVQTEFKERITHMQYRQWLKCSIRISSRSLVFIYG